MTVRSYGWRDRMKIRSSLIFVSLILLVSCSKVNIENENNDMMSRLREKKESTEKLRIEKEGMIDLEEAVDLALKNNTQIKLKEIESQIAKIDKNISFGNFLPRISAMYSISELDRYMSATIPAPDVTIGVLGGITLPSLPVTLTSRMVDKDFTNYALSAQLSIFTLEQDKNKINERKIKLFLSFILFLQNIDQSVIYFYLFIIIHNKK